MKELDKLIPFTHLIDEFKNGPPLVLPPGQKSERQRLENERTCLKETIEEMNQIITGKITSPPLAKEAKSEAKMGRKANTPI